MSGTPAGIAQLVEQLICNQQVGGSSPSTGSSVSCGKLHMGEFPSGQRGQTVNLLLIASVVRIHLPPPTKGITVRWCLFAGGIRDVDPNSLSSGRPATCWDNRSQNWLSSFYLPQDGNLPHTQSLNQSRVCGRIIKDQREKFRRIPNRSVRALPRRISGRRLPRPWPRQGRLWDQRRQG